MLWKRRARPETAPEPQHPSMTELLHRVTLLERDVADLDDRYRRRAARYRKAGIDEEEQAPAAETHNGSSAMVEVAKRRARGFPGRAG